MSGSQRSECLNKTLRRRKNCFTRQRAVRILKVHTYVCVWVFVLTLIQLLNSDASQNRILIFPCWCITDSASFTAVISVIATELKDRTDVTIRNPEASNMLQKESFVKMQKNNLNIRLYYLYINNEPFLRTRRQIMIFVILKCWRGSCFLIKRECTTKSILQFYLFWKISLP